VNLLTYLLSLTRSAQLFGTFKRRLKSQLFDIRGCGWPIATRMWSLLVKRY